MFIHIADFDFADFFADGDHGIAKPIEFGEGFAFGGFDHYGSSDWPGDSGGMETIVDQAFGDVIDFDVGGLFELAQVEDALVGDEAVGAFVEDGVVIF